jgi:hypothetical protein
MTVDHPERRDAVEHVRDRTAISHGIADRRDVGP